jgi:hypothetical protein
VIEGEKAEAARRKVQKAMGKMLRVKKEKENIPDSGSETGNVPGQDVNPNQP